MAHAHASLDTLSLHQTIPVKLIALLIPTATVLLLLPTVVSVMLAIFLITRLVCVLLIALNKLTLMENPLLTALATALARTHGTT